MTTHTGSLAPALALFALTGCNHHVFSPPARMLPLETPATLEPGETGVAVEGAHGGQVFGPNVSTGTLRVRRGVAEEVDAVAEANMLHVHGDTKAGTHPNAYSLRLGTKLRLVEHFAFTMGAGGGASAAGYFFSPDVGVIVAYENEHLVPFLSVRTGFSLPLVPEAVDTTRPDDEEPQIGTPRLTSSVAWSAGLRLPLPLGTPEREGPQGSLLVGLGMIHLYDGEDDATFGSLAAGGEVAF